MPWFSHVADGEQVISQDAIRSQCLQLLDESRSRLGVDFRRVLLLPPDKTRAHSGAGAITEMLYQLLPKSCDVHVIPTLGQHVPHTPTENQWMFGSIPEQRIHVHDWRRGCVEVGTIAREIVRERSDGNADWPIPLHLNRMLMREQWDLIVNVGHVVPHEVLGFANHNKNYFIGLGGKETLCASHMAAAACGIENNLGQLVTPLRACFNWAEEKYLPHLKDVYLQIVMRTGPDGQPHTSGIFVGDDSETYLEAARLSRGQNITVFDEPVPRIVAYMRADEFNSTWVANKSIYRTRLAITDGGELLVLAPGLERFGEQPEVDAFIRKYGYCGTPRVMELYQKNPDMLDLGHATAHLMHGSTEGRFTVRYAPGRLTRQEIEQVGFAWADLRQMQDRYPLDRMTEGWNTMPDGERVFFIRTPSAGLWATKQKLYNRPESSQ